MTDKSMGGDDTLDSKLKNQLDIAKNAGKNSKDKKIKSTEPTVITTPSDKTEPQNSPHISKNAPEKNMQNTITFADLWQKEDTGIYQCLQKNKIKPISASDGKGHISYHQVQKVYAEILHLASASQLWTLKMDIETARHLTKKCKPKIMQKMVNEGMWNFKGYSPNTLQKDPQKQIIPLKQTVQPKPEKLEQKVEIAPVQTQETRNKFSWAGFGISAALTAILAGAGLYQRFVEPINKEINAVNSAYSQNLKTESKLKSDIVELGNDSKIVTLKKELADEDDKNLYLKKQESDVKSQIKTEERSYDSIVKQILNLEGEYTSLITKRKARRGENLESEKLLDKLTINRGSLEIELEDISKKYEKAGDAKKLSYETLLDKRENMYENRLTELTAKKLQLEKKIEGLQK